jgi:hypothetical protein
MVDELDKRHLRPLQKQSYQCMAKCCDSSDDAAALQRCTHDCERRVQLAEKAVCITFYTRASHAPTLTLAPRTSLVRSFARSLVRSFARSLVRQVQLQLNEFQSRLQRCIQRCQDVAQESLPNQPKDSDVSKAQEKLADCAADCACSSERLIPKLQRGIADRLTSIK